MSALKKDRVLRMLNEAQDRVHDAELLARSITTRSDSGSIISILGLEVMLKAAGLIYFDRIKRTHDYRDLYEALPEAVRDKILADAKSRMTGHTDYSDTCKLFLAWRRVFESGRYYYEFYEDKSLEEQMAEGEAWLASGGEIDDAAIQYYPNELRCLIEALDDHISDWLESS